MKSNRIYRKALTICFALTLSFTATTLPAQTTDTLLNKLDSLKTAIDSSGNDQINNTHPLEYNEVTKLTPKTYGILLLSNIKQQITLPFHTNRKDWLKVAAFSAFTGAVAFANKPVNRYAVRLRNESSTVAKVSSFITEFGGLYEIYTLAGLYTYGALFKAEKEKVTTLLATQAYITAGGTQVGIKLVTGAQRPNYYHPITGENGHIFHGPFYHFKKDENGNKRVKEAYTSFPSGHTTAAFAAATVFAMEYKDRPFISILSYSAASLIGLSRITENKHWPVDVLVGAAVGFISGRQVVNNYHRYAKLKQGASKVKELSFNMQYYNGHIQPGLAYKF